MLSHWTAAQLHRMWLPTWAPSSIHLATAALGRSGRDMTRTRRAGIRTHRLELAAEDVVWVCGLPATSPTRTWRDLAAVMGLADLVAAGDGLLRAGTAPDDLASTVESAPRARGVVRLRQALPLIDARSRSHPESHLRVAVALTGLTGFRVNEPVYREEGGWLAEPDISVPEAQIALEYQGADHAEAEQMRKDITRERDMRLDGWRVLYYGPAEVYRRPESIGVEVVSLVRRRAPALLTRSSAPMLPTHRRPLRGRSPSRPSG